ncbi:substrate-binding domain-containing protein [Oceaniovalibus guishaninsula]|nr:substrate-binding domain-containing protein [Oceaniovalibus guishaninsula]
MTPATLLAALALTAAATGAAIAQGRDQVQIAGSSTVLPYATIVAEAFGENFDFPTPVVQSGGSSAGLKLFCEGLGEHTVDIANASRPIRPAEIAACAANGVTDIIEVRFGYDGIVLASLTDGPDFTAFQPADWYRALAETVPVDGRLVPNPNARWSQVDPGLPDVPITAFIPGTKHGTREVFEEKLILQGCRDSGALADMLAAGMDEDAAESACMAIRKDGRAVDIDGDYTETLARIQSNPEGIGVFGLSFFENNADKLKVATIGGVEPTARSVAEGAYPVSRPLFFYVKKAHVGAIPGLREYTEFFLSDQVAGPGGPLARYGLVPDPELAATRRAVQDEKTM